MIINERNIIERIRKLSSSSNEKLVAGIGDDCAEIDLGNGILELVSTDTLVEKVHFDNWHPPELLGRKAAAVNLSDVAAMGGAPKYCLLSLALSDGVSDIWLDGFISGFLQMLSSFKVELIGGDTVRSPATTMLSVTVIGHSEKGKVLERSGAKKGDFIMVSGNLGNAAAGLELCKSGKFDMAAERWPELLKAHLDPDPEIDLGRYLAETGQVNSMMDMSDGLATDLAHICQESGCGAEIDATHLPISNNMKAAAEELGLDPNQLAISGGEDYRLLFTVSEKNADELVSTAKQRIGRDVFRVGRIVDGDTVVLTNGHDRIEIGYQGYDHFK